ncbi:MAG: DUF4386 domain-containing protein [Gammaproteobacteria bacterium]
MEKTLTARQKARIAGLLYVICIVSGFSAEFFVRDKLVAYGDPALTATRILAASSVYRWGFLADLVSFTTGILIAVIFYELFRVVSRPVARTALTFAIVSNTVSIAASIFCYAPLHILSGASYLNTFSPGQLQSLSVLSLRLYQFAFSLNLGLFSVDCFATGYLIYKSTFLPRMLGVLLCIGGVGYLYNSVAYFMPPAAVPDLFPYSYLPSLIAEVSLALWLAIAGVNAVKWQSRNALCESNRIA